MFFYQTETIKGKEVLVFGEYYLDIIDDEDDQASENGREEGDHVPVAVDDKLFTNGSLP